MARIKYRFCCKYHEELKSLLEKNHVKYQIEDYRPVINRSDIIFTLFYHEINDDKLKMLIEQCKITCFTSNQFSKREINEAEWFEVCCNYSKLVPAPNTTPYKYQCIFSENRARHRQQVEPFMIKSFKWQNHNFISTLGSVTELFVSAHVKEIFSQNNITGISYIPVINQKTGMPCEDVFQLGFTHILTKDMLDIKLSDDCRIDICPLCGREQYIVNGHYRLPINNVALKKEIDIYVTNKMFGEGFANHKIIVSRRFFELVKGNSLDRNLEFEPVLTF